jgi:type II secretory pathway predicted ATPase ExeA
LLAGVIKLATRIWRRYKRRQIRKRMLMNIEMSAITRARSGGD